MTMEPDGKMSVQWGTASNADTITGQTAATPTDTEGTGTSANAGVDFFPFPPPLSTSPGKELDLSKTGYLVKTTREQLETVEVFPLAVGQAERIEERIRRQEAEHARQVEAWEALQEKHPELGPIIRLHKPTDYGECQGCDGGPDYSGDWPCRTIELIQEGL